MNIDVEILRGLRSASPGTVSGADLSQKLGVSRAAIWARIDELRRLGYEIEASPHTGYRLVSAPDSLIADDLLSRLGRMRVIGRSIQVFQATTSTNDIAEKLARDGVPGGAVVFAESQTRGRGRLGRKWASPGNKGLWFSVLLRPPIRPQEATRITVASAAAIRRAIEGHTGLKVGIKWPNDLLIGNRKVVGILTELHAELDRVRYIILGVGVDVNLDSADFPPAVREAATSIKAELGRPVSRPDLAVAILRELDADYHRAISGEFSEVSEEWERHCVTLGKDIEIETGGRKVIGRAEALGGDGELLVRTQHGHLERVVGGDVKINL